VSEVWKWLVFEDYISLLQKKPNETVFNHEIFKDYQNKIKITKKQEWEQQKELFEKIIEIEKEKLFYFILAYPQKLVLVKSWEKEREKQFLWYYFTDRRWSESIYSMQWNTIDESTTLYDPNNSYNPNKASTFIYDSFEGNYEREIPEELNTHIFRTRLSDLITFDRANFEKTLSTNTKKKIEIESKWDLVKLWEICDVKIWWTPDRWEYEYWKNWNNEWVSISEMKWTIIYKTKEKINDLGVKKSNVKLIKSWTTLLSFKLSIWKTAIAWKDLYTNEAIAWLCLNNEEKILNKYLFYVFNLSYIDLEKWCFNAFWKSLNSNFLKNEVKIPLPSLDIQQKIVDEINVLEKEEKENKEKLEILKSEIEKIVFWIYSNLIELWEIAEIKKWTSITKIKTISWSIPVIAWWKEPAYYHNESNRNWNIITVSASWANSWFVNYFENPIYASDCNTINSKNENLISTRLIFKFLEIQQDKIYWLQRWQAQPHVYWEDLAKIKIPLPPLEVQKQIVLEIEKIENEIEFLEKDIKTIPEKKKEILKKYL
jgi:restriction endonuclease S subunit